MSLPAFSFPFTHWDPCTLSVTTTSTVTTSRIINSNLLILGLSTGEIAIFSLDSDNTPRLAARLLGHRTSIVALEYLSTVSETSEQHDPLLLSLSADGDLSKWSLIDFRCLQSAPLTTSDDARPQGILAADGLILVYGCNTEIVVLNAESLETVFVWTGHMDWPLVEAGERECTLLTVLRNGDVHSWVVTAKREKRLASVLTVHQEDESRRWSMQPREGWGRIRGWKKLEGGYMLIQGGGLTFHVADAKRESGFVRTCEVEIKGGVAGVEVGTARRTVIVQSDLDIVKIFSLKDGGQLEEVASWSPPESFRDEKIMIVAAFFEGGPGNGKLVIASRPKVQTSGQRPGIDLSIADILQNESGVQIINWSFRALTNSIKQSGGLHPESPSNCSEIFSNMLAVAHGTNVYLYSLSTFLLSYHEPTASISLPFQGSSICLLKRVHIHEYTGTGRGAGLYGGKEYLVAGTHSGDLFIIEAPSYHYSKRLPLFPSSVTSAHLLPFNLGRRLRSTLLVSSSDGTACIIDIERARVMVTFPSHDYSRLISFATKAGKNLVALTYQDGVRREWSMGEEDSGVLLNPPPSRGSGYTPEEKNGPAAESGPGEWRVVNHLQDGRDDEDRSEEGECDNGDGTIQLWDGFCRIGLPTAGINVRAVLGNLEDATKTASQRTRQVERRVVGNHPAIINAKSLLTALIPGGTADLFLDRGDDDEDDEDDDAQDLGEWRFAVDQFFFRRKHPAILGQIGAGNRITMLTPATAVDISPTVTSIKLLAALTLITALLNATGKKELIDTVLEQTLRSHLGKRKVALGVFAKFWSDANPVIRWVARESLDAFMSALRDDERRVIVEYWRGYLPVYVQPELASEKEVARSVILLGKLITDYDNRSYDDSLRKAVARSAELLLNEQEPLYQDTAIEVIGYSWTPFENLFDAYSAIHSLICISATELSEPRRANLRRCFLAIAKKNSPLLASSIANNISHGTPASTPVASLAGSALQGLADTSIAAMRIVAAIVREDKTLFEDVLQVVVGAVLRTLDVTSGLREKVLSTVTMLVDVLVASYNTLAFHRLSQRLVLSTIPGIIIVYDLKNSNTAHMLQGHKSKARQLVFSEDGKSIAAVSRDGNTGGEILVWRFVSGLLSYLGTATTGESDKVLQPRARRWLEGEGEAVVVWVGERRVKAVVGGVETEVSV